MTGRKRPLLLVYLAVAVALPAQEPGRFQLSGFGTLGVVATSTHQAAFARDSTEDATAVDHPTAAVDSRIGLQLGGRITESLQWTFQTVVKNQYDNTWRPEVDWACLTWDPGPDWQIQGGRIGLQGLPNGDYTNVGYTYLWVRPPVEVFGDNLASYIDGLQVTRNFEWPDGTLFRAQVAGGFADQKVVTNGAGAQNYDLTGVPFLAAALEARHGAFRGRLAYGQGTFVNPYGGANVQAFTQFLASYSPLLGDPRPAQVADSLNIKGMIGRWGLLGVSWEKDRIQAQAGVGRVTYSHHIGFPDSWHGYASFGYRFGSVVPYAVWARSATDHASNPDLGPLASLPGPVPAFLVSTVDQAAQGRDTNQTTVSVGLRWDFTDQAALKVQVDRVHALSPGLWRDVQPGWNGDATIMSVTLDFIFGGVR